MMKIIVGENIVKSFSAGNEKHRVLDGVSLEIHEREFISIMGPSGSGKTTLIYAVSGMDSIDSGTVLFDGRNLSALNEKELSDIRRAKMGFVFQQPTLLKNLNILDNIILPAMRDNKRNAAKTTEEAKALMKKVGIGELEKRDITKVSGGQLQRAGICRAVMSHLKIIFGDEPTGALNSTSAQKIMDILSKINTEGTAVMLVTHDAKVAARTERIMFICDGNIVSEMRFKKFNGTGIEDRIEAITAKMREIEI